MVWSPPGQSSQRRFGHAWVSLTIVLAFHVLDEALTDFLSVYNPIVREARARIGWFPMPEFTFGVWLTGLCVLLILLLALVAVGVSWIARPAHGGVSLRRHHAPEWNRSPCGINLPAPMGTWRDDRTTSDRCVDLAAGWRARRSSSAAAPGCARVKSISARSPLTTFEAPRARRA